MLTMSGDSGIPGGFPLDLHPAVVATHMALIFALSWANPERVLTTEPVRTIYYCLNVC